MYKSSDIKNVYQLNFDFFQIKWYVTNWCNYKCPYCCQSTEFDNSPYNQNKNWIEESTVLKMAKNLNELLNKLNITKRIELNLLGGEITFYNWPKILPYIKNIYKISITTNFSNTLDYYKNLYIYCFKNGIFLSLLCSYHETGDEFFEKILELSKWCLEKNYSVPKITFVVDNDFDFYMFDKFPELKNINCHFSEKIFPNGECAKLNDEVLKKVQELRNSEHPWTTRSFDIKIRRPRWLFDLNGELRNFSPVSMMRQLEEGKWITDKVYCDAGINSLCLMSNGDVKRCICNPEIIGNLFNFNYKFKSSLCSNILCRLCQPVNITKADQIDFDPFISPNEVNKNEV